MSSQRRWNTLGSLRTASGETILYSGNPNEDDQHAGSGADFVKSTGPSYLFQRQNYINYTTICFNKLCHQKRKRDVTLVMGDFSAKTGNKNADMESVIGRRGLSSISEKGEILTIKFLRQQWDKIWSPSSPINLVTNFVMITWCNNWESNWSHHNKQVIEELSSGCESRWE